MKNTTTLLTALALALSLTGAKAITFTNNTTIGSGNTTYDGQEVAVSGCTLTVNGVHNFASLLLTASAVLTHSPAPAGETNNRLDLVIAGALTIDATSRVDVNAKGYAPDKGPGKGLSDYAYPSSGGHGGPGGNNYNNTLAGGAPYDSLLAPTQWGSGGGNMGFSTEPGGAGGGVIRLHVGGVLTVAGQLSANGESTYDSGGAGGSLYLTVGTLAGGGAISAQGGDASYVLSGGGGGGRIAIYYGSSVFSGAIGAPGGLGGSHPSAHCGGAGTLYTQANSQSVGDLLLDNTGRTNAMETPITTPVAYRLTLTNVTAYATNALTLTGLRVSTNGLLTHPFQGPRLQVLVQGNAVVEAGGVIGAEGRGYPANTGPGAGSGGISWVSSGSGAGHGGQGYASYYGAPGGGTYGSETSPVDCGSGGGGGTWPNRGGGAMQLTVEGTLTVDGRVSANADAATGGMDGGGSGGSIWLSASRLNGVGSITANGQVSGYSLAGSGGGGRIAIYTGVNEFAGNVVASGGASASRPGGNGTVHYGANVPAGLISWWRGEGDASDTMGVHPGTAQGGLGYAPGQAGQGFVFDGVNDYVALGNWFDLQVFTLAMWVKPGAAQVQHADLIDNNHTGTRSWVIQSANVSDSTHTRFFFGGDIAIGTVEFNLRKDDWQQLVISTDSNRVTRGYLDGKPVGTNFSSGPIHYDGTQNLCLGRHGWLELYSRFFTGMLDEVMVFNRALAPAEVASLYYSQGGPLQLSIQPVPGGVLLSWPASAEGFGLVSRANLTAGAWESVTNTPSLNGDRKEVLLPANTPVQRFFRLAQ